MAANDHLLFHGYMGSLSDCCTSCFNAGFPVYSAKLDSTRPKEWGTYCYCLTNLTATDLISYDKFSTFPSAVTGTSKVAAAPWPPPLPLPLSPSHTRLTLA